MARRVLISIASAAALWLIAAPAAVANHQEGDYEGTTAAGGKVTFFVLSGSLGDLVEGFVARDVPTACGVQTGPTGNYTDPIATFLPDHPFAHTTNSQMNYRGTFPAPGVASGTVTWVNCGNEVTSWTASYVPLQEPGAGGKGGSQGGSVPKWKRKCLKIENKLRRKRCIKKHRPKGAAKRV